MATLQYDFRVVGLNSVMAAFRSLEQRALQHNRTIDRMLGSASRGAGRGAPGAAGRLGGPQYDAHTRERARVMRQRDADDRREMAAAVQRNRRHLAFKDQMYREEARLQDAHARKQIAAQRTFEKQRTRERDRGAREAMRARVRTGMARYDNVVGGLTSLGSKAASAIALGGGAALAAGISSELRLNKATTLLAVMSKQAGEQGSIKDIQKGLVSRVREVGIESGLDRNELTSGMMQFFDAAGRIDVAKEMLPFFAKMADVSGSSLEEIGTTAGQAFMQSVAAGMSQTQAIRATEDILSAFAGQSSVGTIGMRDFVKQGPKLLATAQRFNMSLPDAAGLMAAFAQTSPLGGAPGAAEAGTSVQRFADELSTASKRFENKGVQVYETNAAGQRVMRNPFEITKDVMRKTGGDEQQFNEFFKNVRSIRAVKGLFTIYSKAGGGEKGMAAVDAEVGRFMKARLTPQQINEGAAAIRETPARQFEAAFNQFKDEVGKNFLPALTKLAPAMTKLVSALEPVVAWLGKFVEQAAQNPWGTIIDIIKAQLVLSIGKAAIGEAIRAQIMKMLLTTGAPGSPGGPGVPPILPGGPKGGPGGGLFGLLSKLYFFGNLLQLGSDAPSQTGDEDSPLRAHQEEVTEKMLRRYMSGEGEIYVEYSKPSSFGIPVGASGSLSPQQLQAEINAGNITAQDFIRTYGLEGAKKLGAVTEGGQLSPTVAKDFGVQAAGEKNKQAAETFTRAVAQFESIVGDLGTGGLVGLFSLNRGTAPGEANPSSGGRQ